MTRGRSRVLLGAVTLVALLSGSGCSSTGSNELVCNSIEIAPSSQPGATDPDAALDWFLENGDSGFATTGFEESGSSDTRRVYSDGSNQVSVGRLPTDEGEAPIWVVMMIYECS